MEDMMAMMMMGAMADLDDDFEEMMMKGSKSKKNKKY